MNTHRSLFSLNSGEHYLNCAYMSPLLKSVEDAALKELGRRRNPGQLKLEDFFEPVSALKASFSRLISGEHPDRISLIPSVSYGLANAARNIKPRKGGKILVLEGQFPSNYYAWIRLCREHGMDLHTIARRKNAKAWNQEILENIDGKTVAVAMAPLHWADGLLYDCPSIGRRCREVGAYFILDGTQAVGAMPFNIGEVGADALVCASYKWLLGPYGFGLAYYGDRFDGGIPLEESWFAKKNSDRFSELVNYEENYRGSAWRYNVGESSNFIYVAMMNAALNQILSWDPDLIQRHCRQISEDFRKESTDLGFTLGEDGDRAGHLFGLLPPDNFSWNKFTECTAKVKVYVSQRGQFIRISPHLYNSEKDLQALLECLRSSID